MALRTLGNWNIRAAATAVLLVLFGGFSAHAALIAYQVASKHQIARAVSGDAQGQFPGTALLKSADELAAPAAGATGTTTLPDVPVPANYDAAALDASIRPARPFSLAGASSEARSRAQQCLTTVIYYEAASESEEGQRAVAQVVLNRVRHPAFPATVCGVVFQGSERTTGCQFSFACDGSMTRQPSRDGWARASRYAADALSGRVFAPVGLATHYHTYAVTPAWNRSLVMTAAIGAHFFHRWQGWWGTPAAFSQGYRGGEPFPGPHLRPIAPVTIEPKVTMASLEAGAAPSAIVPIPRTTPVSIIQPAYADRSVAITQPAVADTLPQSTMLDRWKDSGKPLR